MRAFDVISWGSPIRVSDATNLQREERDAGWPAIERATPGRPRTTTAGAYV
jgi:hypothetical protein